MKTFVWIFTAVAALATASASADPVTTGLVHEIELHKIRLPATANGTLSFRSCGDCELVTLRASIYTQYFLNGKSVDLPLLRSAVLRAGSQHRDSGVLVMHSLADDGLVYVKVDFF